MKNRPVMRTMPDDDPIGGIVILVIILAGIIAVVRSVIH